jgi:hypothetical protein
MAMFDPILTEDQFLHIKRHIDEDRAGRAVCLLAWYCWTSPFRLWDMVWMGWLCFFLGLYVGSWL